MIWVCILLVALASGAGIAEVWPFRPEVASTQPGSVRLSGGGGGGGGGADSSSSYRLEVNFSRPSCETWENITVSNNADFTQWVRKQIGPDELLVFIEGPTLQAFVPALSHAIGGLCGLYHTDFVIREAGEYRVKVLWTRSGYQAVNELNHEYPGMDLKTLVDELVHLDDDLSSKQQPAPCHHYWSATQPGYLSPQPCKIDAKKNLALFTHINVSSMSGKEQCEQDMCADKVDMYAWKSTCNVPIYTQQEASSMLAGKKILFVGDSHMRTLSGSLVAWACDAERPVLKRSFEFMSLSVNSTMCQNFELKYEAETLCNVAKLPPAGTYDLVVMNCGHHLAASQILHFTEYEYKDVVQNLVTSALGKKYTSNDFAWMESVAVMIRNDAFVFNYKDWRTYHRLKHFNHLANGLMKDNKFSIMPTFASTLPFVDKMCDIAHFTAPDVLMPNFQWILNKLAKKQRRLL